MPLFRTTCLLLCLTLPAVVAARTVGLDPDCDHSSLQAAIDAASSGETIRITSGNHVGGFVVADKSLTLQGGFATCTSATSTGRSTLDGANLHRVMRVSTSSTTAYTVTLQNLLLQRGNSTLGAGLYAQGRPGALSVLLRNVEVSDNAGGGIYLDVSGDRVRAGLMLGIDNASSLLRNIVTNGIGGGLYCWNAHDQGNGVLVRIGTTLIHGNTASEGGGMAFNGCRGVRLHSGGPFVGGQPTGGIVGNHATRFGGGLYLTQGAEVEMSPFGAGGYGDAAYQNATLILQNQAQLHGGGFYVASGSTLTLLSTRVESNASGVQFGGGGYVQQSLLTMREQISLPCQAEHTTGTTRTLPPCSTLIDNQADEFPADFGLGGALALSYGATAHVRNTYIQRNRARDGAAIHISHGSASPAAASDIQAHLEGVLVSGNTGTHSLFTVASWPERIAGLDILHSTVAGNTMTAASNPAVIATVADADAYTRVDLRSSIAHHPGAVVVRRWGEGSTVSNADCLIALPALADSGITGAVRGYSSIQPGFVDAANADFRLQQDSPAIDYCDIAAPAPTSVNDLDGKLRGQTWIGPVPIAAPGAIPGSASRYDLGAFEAQLDLINIFSDGFE